MMRGLFRLAIAVPCTASLAFAHACLRRLGRIARGGPLSLLPAAPVLLVGVSSALAHAHLQTASPPVNGTVVSAPNEIVINFTESIEPRFSSITVRDAKGERVDKNDAHVDPRNAKRFIVGVRTLGPGTYLVVWQVTSVDTHKTDGSYHFTIRQ